MLSFTGTHERLLRYCEVVIGTGFTVIMRKVMDFTKNGRGHGKVMELHFLVQYFVLFENWKHNLIIEQNMPQKAKFSAFLSHRKYKLIMEKPLDFIVQFFVIPVGDIYFERVPQ